MNAELIEVLTNMEYWEFEPIIYGFIATILPIAIILLITRLRK